MSYPFPEWRNCPDCDRPIRFHDFGPPGADGEPAPLCRAEDVKRMRAMKRAAKYRTIRKLRRAAGPRN